MADEQLIIIPTEADPVPAEETTAAPTKAPTPRPARGRGEQGGRRGRRPQRRTERPKSQYDQRIIAIRRVARVVAGGRRFSFSVAIVIGDRKGTVAVGIGKGSDTALAINKAVNNAKKHLLKVNLTKDMRIPHETMAKYSASRVVLMPATGRGMTAGSSVRHVLELAGVRDVSAKILSRSKNQLNNARAAVKALTALRV